MRKSCPARGQEHRRESAFSRVRLANLSGILPKEEEVCRRKPRILFLELNNVFQRAFRFCRRYVFPDVQLKGSPNHDSNPAEYSPDRFDLEVEFHRFTTATGCPYLMQ